MKYLALLTLLIGCGGVSPWEAEPNYRDLTNKHLSNLHDTGHLEPFNFSIVGDSQVGLEGFNNARKRINQQDTSFTVILGDLTDRGLKKEWDWVGNIVEKFDRPVLTVVGNHDGLSNGKELYREMFGPLNYSFYYNGVKFVMWNNNHYEWNIDLDWLEIEANYYPTIILSHQPPYSGTMTDEQEARWFEIRHNGNVISSVHGHMHHFYETNEDGLPIFTVERVEHGAYGIGKFENSEITFEERK